MSAAATPRPPHSTCRPRPARRARSRCPDRRASRTARCCSRRSRAGDTRVRGLLDADDVDRMRDALRALGVRVERRARTRRGRSCTGPAARSRTTRASLFLGNAGTAFRPLTAVLAFAGGRYELAGVAADARAADRRSGRRAARAGRRRSLPRVAKAIRRWRSAPVRRRTRRSRRASPCAATCRASSSSALLMALPLLTARAGRRHHGRRRGRADLAAVRRDHDAT